MRMTRDQYPVLPGVDPDEATDWDRFVIDHRCLLNLRLHVFSAFLFWFTLIASVLTFSGWWFLAFCLSASPAALAHRVSGEGNPQLIPTTGVAFFATRVAYRVLRGTYHQDVARAEALLGTDTGRRR